MVFPVNVAAGGSVTITAAHLGGANAVISGVFLGGTGSTPLPPPSAPQGNWVGTYGHVGYSLGGWNGSSDLSYLPNASLGLTQGTRCACWGSSTADIRALQSPDATTRVAAVWYDPNQLQLSLNFSAGYQGNLELYAVDWDSTGRRETVTVNDGSGPQTVALSNSFNQGAWMVFPVNVAAGGSVTITAAHLGGANAVISGVFLG
jgi:hypothetical protein